MMPVTGPLNGVVDAPSAPILSFAITLVRAVELTLCVFSSIELTSLVAIGASSKMAIFRNLAGPVFVLLFALSIKETAKSSVTETPEFGAVFSV